MAVATRCQTDVVMVVVDDGDVPTSVHPAGAVGAVADVPVAINSMPLPEVTAAGTVTVSDVAFPFVMAPATNAIGVAAAAGDTCCDAEAVAPSAFVTVSVAV